MTDQTENTGKPDEFQLAPGSRILDVGCGTGRHAIELARRGFEVTGVDISEGMLAEAEKASSAAGVAVRLIQCDATMFVPDQLYDAALCLCEGAIGLLSMDEDAEEHDGAILRNISAALPVDGPLLMTTLNGYRKIRSITQSDVESGEFDLVTAVHHITEEMDLPEGKKTITYKERLYTPPELVALFKRHGFYVDHIWGGTAGRWARRSIDLDEIEVMLVARKVANAR